MILLVLLLILNIFSGCSPSGATDAPANEAVAAASPVAIQVAPATARELDRFVEAVGTLSPNDQVTVSNQVEATVERMFVDFGDTVQQGQLLAQLDTRELELAVQQQRAALQQELARLGLTDENASVNLDSSSQVRQAEAGFADARIILDRAKSLYAEQVIPRQQLDSAQARHDAADANLRSARETVQNIRATIQARKVSLNLAEKKLSDAKIEAPMSGVVQQRFVSEGQFLKNNSPILLIVQNNPLKLQLEIPEVAIQSIGPGRPVRFEVDTFPGRTFTAKVSRLSPAVSEQSRTLKIEANVDNSDGALKPGMFVRASIKTDRREKGLVVPSEALFTFAGLEKLFIEENGKVSERIVRSGARIDAQVEILEGLKEGERVAISNLGSLQQGREVTVR